MVFADGGIGARPCAEQLVQSLGPQQLKVEGLFKRLWGFGVKPDPQNHLTVGWYNPAEMRQATHKKTQTVS